MGIKLTRQELEQAEKIVTAEIGERLGPGSGLVKKSTAHPAMAAAGEAEAAARAAARGAAGSSSSAGTGMTGLKPPYGDTAPASMICDIQ
jgi:hypothetical protein